MAFEGFTNQSGETTGGSSGGSSDDTDRDEQDTTTTSTDPNDGTGFESRGDTTTSGGSTDTSQDSTDSGSSGSGDESTTTQQTTTQEFTGQEQEAVNQFLKENQAYSKEDIADVQEQEDDAYTFTFTESGRRTYFDENYSAGAMAGPAPAMASQIQSPSGETATVVFNQGIETGSGDVAEQAQQFEDQIVESTPGIDESDVSIDFNAETGQFEAEIDREAAREAERQRAGDATDYSSIGGDATTVSDRELQKGEVEERAREEIENRLSDEDSELAQRLAEQGLGPDDVTIDTAATSDGISVDLSVDQDAEKFGDSDPTLFGINVKDELSSVVESVGEGADEAGLRASLFADDQFYDPSNYSDDIFVGGVTTEDVDEDALEDFETVEGTAENLAYGAGQGVVNLASAPASVVLSGIQGAELAGEFVESAERDVEQGTLPDFSNQETFEDSETVGLSNDLTEATQQSVDAAEGYIRENPARFTGQAAGSLVASGVVFKAASASSKLSAATRWSIQPGEEIASAVGTRALRSSSAGRRVLSKFPGGRLDNEEIAIKYGQKAARAGKQKARGLRNSIDDPQVRGILREEVARARGLAGDERAQFQIPKSEVETETENTKFEGPTEAELAELERRETSELAKQAQEQVDFRVEQEFGDEVLDRVPEFEDTVTKSTVSRDDISDSISGRGNPQVAGGGEMSFEENFNRAIERKRQAEQTSFEIEEERLSGVEEDLELESELEEEISVGQLELEVEAESDVRQAAEVIAGQEADSFEELGFDPALEFEGEAEGELSRELELESEAELSLEQELSQELELESESEVEVERERESETESEFEFGSESETELEEFDLGGDVGEGDLLRDEFGVKEKRYEYELRDLV